MYLGSSIKAHRLPCSVTVGMQQDVTFQLQDSVDRRHERGVGISSASSTDGLQGTAPNESPALEGLRVLEISASDSFAGSLLSMLLADQGAAVVKIGVDSANAPVEDARARETSREARARAGIDRNKRVLDPLASASEIDRLAALADVVILPYDTGIPELDPVGLRERYPSLLVVTLCEFDELGELPPDEGTVGAATGTTGLVF